MRRFSQRNSLVTLSDINITPLLDLAFVLLIIFVITTPLLEQGLTLKLARGGSPDKPLAKKDIRTVEISPQGTYMLDKRHLSLDLIERELVRDFRANPNLVIYIRADETGSVKNFLVVVDRLRKNGIKNFSFRTEPPNQR
jgi:biopolymer transport protein ExbD